MKHGLRGVTALPVCVMAGVGAQNMVINHQVGITQPLDGLHVIADRGRVGADLGLGKHNPYFHGTSPVKD